MAAAAAAAATVATKESDANATRDEGEWGLHLSDCDCLLAARDHVRQDYPVRLLREWYKATVKRNN